MTNEEQRAILYFASLPKESPIREAFERLYEKDKLDALIQKCRDESKVKFSRDRLTEFVKNLSGEATRIVISISNEGDSALVFPAFRKTTLVVEEGQSVVLGEVIPGSVPERHVLTVE